MSLSVNSSLPKGLSLLVASTNTSLSEGLPGEFAALLSGEMLGLNGLDKSIKLTPEELLGKFASLLPEERLEAGGLIAEISGQPFNKSGLEKNTKLTPGELLGKFASLLPKEGLVTGEAIAEISGKRLNANSLEKDNKLSPEDLSDQNTSIVDPSMLATLTVTPPFLPEIQLSGKIGLQAGTEKLEKQTSELIAVITGDEKGFDRLEQRKSSEGLGGFERLVSSAQRTLESPSTGNETAIFAAEGNPGETSNASLSSLASSNLAIKQPREGLSTDQSGIHTHLRENSWSQQFGEKIVWLAKNDQQSAQININPPELGPVQITLNLSGGEAKVTFASPHMEVRQAIENSLPQLKEMLLTAGINLGQTNVGANLAQQNPDNPYQNANGKHLADENAILPANDKALNVTTSSVLQKGRGLVDLFA
ncbi:MAG: flagellar hook-length control protein FliK [Betaproteobacteria bacterium]|nr:flagellar hook-length control protein FliK [Betaproteobacteria bacterium]